MKIRLQITIDFDLETIQTFFKNSPTAKMDSWSVLRSKFTIRKLNDNNPAMDKEL